MTDDAPLILTLTFDKPSFARFDALRTKHFPPKRNMIPAHLTLFHHLPGDRLDEISQTLDEMTADHDPIACEVTGLRMLGKGVAYEVSAPRVERMRNDMAGQWFDWLTAQDRQRFNPHITIQNKVEPAAAKALFSELEGEFTPFSFVATGFALWRYRGGPWDAVETFAFTPRDRHTDEED